MISEPSPSSPLVLKIRRDSLTTSSAGETDSNRQLLLKLKKNEHGELISQNPPPPSSDVSMSTEVLLAEQPAVQSNGHHHVLYQPLPSSPPITNMLANLPSSPATTPIRSVKEGNDTRTHRFSFAHSSQVPVSVASTVLTAIQTAETYVGRMNGIRRVSSLSSHTKELLDEALDSVKNVLMQTFKKNLESGGDLK